MNTRSVSHGAGTSDVDVIDVSKDSLVVRVGHEHLSLSYANFPWFRDAPLGHVLHVTMPSPGCLRWPELDVDLAIDSIRHPERYPLVARQ